MTFAGSFAAATQPKYRSRSQKQRATRWLGHDELTRRQRHAADEPKIINKALVPLRSNCSAGDADNDVDVLQNAIAARECRRRVVQHPIDVHAQGIARLVQCRGELVPLIVVERAEAAQVNWILGSIGVADAEEQLAIRVKLRIEHCGAY